MGSREENRRSLQSFSTGTEVPSDIRGNASCIGPPSINDSSDIAVKDSSPPSSATAVAPPSESHSPLTGSVETFAPSSAPTQHSIALAFPSSATSESASILPLASDTPRSRSRKSTSRRVSSSTVASSVSPSSDRVPHVKDGKDSDKKKLGIIGVCALDSKARSKPSRSILNRLISKGEFEVIVFGDKIILDEDVENWPVCDFLISFFSDGFPLEKAIEYARLRRPFCVNDLPMQMVLWDRRVCLKILDSQKVPTPKRIEISRDGGPKLVSAEFARQLFERTGVKLDGPEDGTGGGAPAPQNIKMQDNNDTLVVDGVELRKPFVEKPVNGEDHNIWIYYPGGGGRRLFRKVNNKSSERDDSLLVPRGVQDEKSSYIYEQFLKVDNAEDVKAYTVGPEFCHAETRKSPVVDGLVKRNTHGKEIRYITSLSLEEASIAARISNSFGQTVCGFDLLRANGQSFVIDVNGWSFVKDNNEYYDKCASILKQMFIRERNRRDGSIPAAEPEETRESRTQQTQRKAGIGEHRSALKSILRSPSVSRITGRHHHHHSRTDGSKTPEKFGTAGPLSSSTSLERPTGGISLPLASSTEMLPPASVAPPKSQSNATLPIAATEPSASLPPPASKSQWRLKGMVSVIRHADRTPKQKFKFTFHTKPFVDLLKGHQEEVLIIGEAALNSVLEAVEQALREGVEDAAKLSLLKTSLLKKGSWAGTKVQIKPMFRKPKKEELSFEMVAQATATSVSDVMKAAEKTSSGQSLGESAQKDALELAKVVSQGRSNSLSDHTMSRIAAAENNLILDKLQLIIKWGGEPTHSARYQAQELGESYRNDLKLMNREVLKNVSVYTSSERRVTTSAQIFAASFLNQKEVPPDFCQVRKDLLDDSNAAKDEMDKVKKKLKTLLRAGAPPPPQFAWPANMPEPSIAAQRVIELMHFHRRVMHSNFAKLQNGTAETTTPIRNASTENVTTPTIAISPDTVQTRWCSGEDGELFKERWEKLFSEFCNPEKVDPSKVSELYDTMKFDALHNRQFLEWVFTPDSKMLEEEDGQTAVLEESQVSFQSTTIATSHEKSSSDTNLEAKGQQSHHENLPRKVAHRIGIRRKSETHTPDGQSDSMASSKTTPDYLYESYFNLFTGSGSSSTRVKSDARLGRLRELYRLSKVMFDYIGPQEYGITDSEKLEIGLLTSLPLLREIVADLEEVQASETAKSFIYFTKESHIYTLLNCILEGGIETKIARNAIPELDYLSQISFELYESQNATLGHEPDSYNHNIRITLSPGCHVFDPLDVQLDSKHSIGCAPRRTLTPHADWRQVIETLRAKFHTVKLPKSFVAVDLSEKASMEAKDKASNQPNPETTVENGQKNA